MDIVRAIQKDGNQALKSIYAQVKPVFLNYMLRYTGDEDLRLDAFHEAMIAFYEYCRDGKYDPQRSSPKTIIIMMGRAYIINRLKKENKMVSQNPHDKDNPYSSMMQNWHKENTNKSDIEIRQALDKLGEKCKQLLIYFYYYNFGIDVIRERMEYKNDNVVSSHKSRCIKQLKENLKA